MTNLLLVLLNSMLNLVTLDLIYSSIYCFSLMVNFNIEVKPYHKLTIGTQRTRENPLLTGFSTNQLHNRRLKGIHQQLPERKVDMKIIIRTIEYNLSVVKCIIEAAYSTCAYGEIHANHFEHHE